MPAQKRLVLWAERQRVVVSCSRWREGDRERGSPAFLMTLHWLTMYRLAVTNNLPHGAVESCGVVGPVFSRSSTTAAAAAAINILRYRIRL